MGIITKLLKTGLIVGAGITAYQANEKTKRENAGQFNTDSFVRNFKDLAIVNAKYVVDMLKGKSGGKATKYRYSDKGENGYTYAEAKPAKAKPAKAKPADAKPEDANPAEAKPEDAEPAGDKLNEVFETMKEKAPEVIGKVQDFVEDVRENAPEYKEKAKDFVEDVKEAAKKALDKKDE